MSSPAQPIQQNAPVAPSVPAPAAPPIDNLVQPGGNFQPSALDATGPGGTSINQETAAAQAANAKYASDAAAPLKVAPVPGMAAPGTPHARLLNMIQGLAVGLGSFGTSLATHGREGGAPEVEDYYAKQDEMRLQNQQAAQQAKDAGLSQDITMAQLHMENAKTLQSLLTLPGDLTTQHLNQEKSEQELQSGQFENQKNQADFAATHGGMSPQEFNDTLSGTGTPNTQGATWIRGNAQQKLSAASQNQEVGPNDLFVQNLQKVLADPNSSPQAVWRASQQLDQEIQLKAGTTKANTDQANASSAATKARFAAPTAQASLSKDQAQAALANRTVAQLNPNPQPPYTPPATPFKMSQAGLTQYMTSQHQSVPPNFATLYGVAHYQIDPNSYTKYTRPGSGQMDKATALNYIRTYINPNFDEKNYDAVKNMQKSFASPKLSDAGGTLIAFQTANGHLQQFQQAATALNNGDVQTLNKIANTFGVEVGKSPVITFNAIRAALGGEIGKIFKGGAADVPGTQDIIGILNSNQSPQQMADVAKTYQHLMNSKAATLVQQYYVYTGYLPPQASWIDPSLLPPGAAVQAGGTAGAQPSAQPAVGTVKTFPNGNKGVWDGRGWVKQ